MSLILRFYILLIFQFCSWPLLAFKDAAQVDKLPAKTTQVGMQLSENLLPISEVINAHVVEAIRVTWRGDNVAAWRQAYYQAACSGDIPGIAGFPIYRESEESFRHTFMQHLQQAGISIAETETAMFNDLVHTYYSSFALMYTFGVSSGLMAMDRDYPTQRTDICFKTSQQSTVKPEDFTKAGYKYLSENALEPLPTVAQRQYKLVAQLGKLSGIVFLRSSYPRMHLLLNTSMARVFVDFEKFKQVEQLYLNSAPFMGEDGYIQAFNEVGAEHGYPPLTPDNDDWQMVNHIWDTQRRAFYLGITSVLRRFEKMSPEDHKALGEQVQAGIETLLETYGAEILADEVSEK